MNERPGGSAYVFPQDRPLTPRKTWHDHVGVQAAWLIPTVFLLVLAGIWSGDGRFYSTAVATGALAFVLWIIWLTGPNRPKVE